MNDSIRYRKEGRHRGVSSVETAILGAALGIALGAIAITAVWARDIRMPQRRDIGAYVLASSRLDTLKPIDGGSIRLEHFLYQRRESPSSRLPLSEKRQGEDQ